MGTLMLEVLDVGKPEGRRITSDLDVRTVPAMIIDGKPRSLGPSTLAEGAAP
jgi:hypothetical protein